MWSGIKWNFHPNFIQNVERCWRKWYLVVEITWNEVIHLQGYSTCCKPVWNSVHRRPSFWNTLQWDLDFAHWSINWIAQHFKFAEYSTWKSTALRFRKNKKPLEHIGHGLRFIENQLARQKLLGNDRTIKKYCCNLNSHYVFCNDYFRPFGFPPVLNKMLYFLIINPRRWSEYKHRYQTPVLRSEGPNVSYVLFHVSRDLTIWSVFFLIVTTSFVLWSQK